MKCNSRIYYWANKRKNNKRVLHTIVSIRGRDSNEISWIEKNMNDNEKVDPNFEVCDGDISIEILAEDEPYMGGTSAKLEVKYKCTKCSCNYYKDLPNEYNINEFFNDWLNKYE